MRRSKKSPYRRYDEANDILRRLLRSRRSVQPHVEASAKRAGKLMDWGEFGKFKDGVTTAVEANLNSEVELVEEAASIQGKAARAINPCRPSPAQNS